MGTLDFSSHKGVRLDLGTHTKINLSGHEREQSKSTPVNQTTDLSAPPQSRSRRHLASKYNLLCPPDPSHA